MPSVGRKGAVVALDPTNRPHSRDGPQSRPLMPNLMSGHEYEPVNQAYRDYLEDPDKPLVNRAIGGDLYPPGSVFQTNCRSSRS